jgi:predicted Zn-dependent peptidase
MKFEKVITNCGAPLYVFPMRHATSVAVGILTKVGTRDEKPGEDGIAHAFEHMVFQGNERLPDSKSITGEIETIGGYLNAYTNQENTFHFRIVPEDALQLAVNSLGSLLNSPLIRDDDITKEMKNIVQEIKRANDNPAGYCGRIYSSLIYGDHPMGKDTLGTKESVLGFRRADFLHFRNRFYDPSNYTFIVVGKTTPLKAAKAFDRVFRASANYTKKNVRPIVPLPQRAYNRISKQRDIEQANVYLGTVTTTPTDPASSALDFYGTMIGGGMSFPLFQDVRDKLGLCYAIQGGHDQGSDCGTFDIYIGTEPARVQEAISAIHEVIIGSCTKELFEKARTNLIGEHQVASLSTSPAALIMRAAKKISLTGEPLSPEEIKRDIEVQTLRGVQDAVERHLFDASKYCYALVGPKGTTV